MRVKVSVLVVLIAAAPQLASAQMGLTPSPPPPPAEVISPGEGESEPVFEKLPPPEKMAAPEQPPPEPVKAKEFNAVRLQGLNKVTARVSTIVSPLGTVMRFGNLEIIAKRCWQASPEEQPENAAFLEIRELKPGEGPLPIFNGWMFASSPALSSIEHPVYDITVVACEHFEELE